MHDFPPGDATCATPFHVWSSPRSRSTPSSQAIVLKSPPGTSAPRSRIVVPSGRLPRVEHRHQPGHVRLRAHLDQPGRTEPHDGARRDPGCGLPRRVVQQPGVAEQQAAGLVLRVPRAEVGGRCGGADDMAATEIHGGRHAERVVEGVVVDHDARGEGEPPGARGLDARVVGTRAGARDVPHAGRVDLEARHPSGRCRTRGRRGRRPGLGPGARTHPHGLTARPPTSPHPMPTPGRRSSAAAPVRGPSTSRRPGGASPRPVRRRPSSRGSTRRTCRRPGTA